jgi:hypothetical protein
VRPPASLLVDAHVHFHPCFSWERFLNAAAANFAVARRQLDLGEGTAGCLMLTESAGVHAFRRLRARLERASVSGWDAAPASDDCAVVLRGARGDVMLLVAGRQIVTAEKLEVLALGSDRDFVDGLPIRDVLARVSEEGAVPVIPWGFGKWWFGRGRVLRGLIEGGLPYRFFLGDNGGRPQLSVSSPLFEAARARGIPVLPGSDPLPFDDQVSRAGGYGFELAGEDIPVTRPTVRIREALLRLSLQPRVFGRRETLAGFVRSQIRMQRVKRSRRSRH